jgi:hypothetical protein
VKHSTKHVPNGIYEGLDAEAYHADDALGSSSIKVLATKTPAHFREYQRKPVKPSSKMTLGSLIHCMVLEPGEEFNRFAVQPASIKQRRGKAWDEWVVTIGNREVVKQSDWDAAERACAAVMSHPVAPRVLSGRRECSAFWTDENGVRVKARFDALPESGEVELLNIEGDREAYPLARCMCDLKSSASAHPNDWGRFVLERMGYHVQAGSYRRLLNALGEDRDRWLFVVVETSAPFAVAVYELSLNSIGAGEAMAAKACRQYAASTDLDDWAGYPTEIGLVSVSDWTIEAAQADAYVEPDIEKVGF